MQTNRRIRAMGDFVNGCAERISLHSKLDRDNTGPKNGPSSEGCQETGAAALKSN
jgi:hypothetical protein